MSRYTSTLSLLLLLLLSPTVFSVSQKTCDKCNSAVDQLMSLDRAEDEPLSVSDCARIDEAEHCAKLFAATSRAADLLVSSPSQACMHSGFCSLGDVDDSDTLVSDPTVSEVNDDEAALSAAEKNVEAAAPSSPLASIDPEEGESQNAQAAQSAESSFAQTGAETEADAEDEDEDEDEEGQTFSGETMEKLEALYNQHKDDPAMVAAARVVADDEEDVLASQFAVDIDGEAPEGDVLTAEEDRMTTTQTGEAQADEDDAVEDENIEDQEDTMDGPNDPATNDAIVPVDSYRQNLENREDSEKAEEGDVLVQEEDSEEESEEDSEEEGEEGKEESSSEDEDEDEDEDDDDEEISGEDVANFAEKLSSILEAKADRLEAHAKSVGSPAASQEDILLQDASADLAEGSPAPALYESLEAYHAKSAASSAAAASAPADDADDLDEETKNLPVDMLYQRFHDDVEAELAEATAQKPEEPVIMDFSQSKY